MMKSNNSPNLISLDTSFPIWDRFFSVAPLVLIGSTEEDGSYNLAPKHMATSLGWENYFGFVCTSRHNTFKNIEREGVFTVSFPRPSQIILASLAASPRWEDGAKPILPDFEVFPATEIDGWFIEDANLYFECERYKVMDGFGSNSLIAGKIVAAHLRPEILREEDVDDQMILFNAPLLVYLAPGRFAEIKNSFSFPFPNDMQK